MALTVASLKAKIKTEIETKFGAAEDADMLLDFGEAMAQAIFDEFTMNAVTTTVVAGGSSAGTYPGTIG